MRATGTAFIDNFVIRDGLLGDYDLDGDVDLADFTVWKQSLNSSVATPGYFADGNNSGGVDAADFTVWRDNLAYSIVSAIGSGGLAGGNAVPEPSSWLLFLLGLLPAHRLLGRWRRSFRPQIWVFHRVTFLAPWRIPVCPSCPTHDRAGQILIFRFVGPARPNAWADCALKGDTGTTLY